MLHLQRIVVALAVAALLGLTAGFASATDWFVRPDGSDSNTGLGNTSALAFKTIQNAIDTSKSLDTIYVAAGTYVEQLTVRDKSLTIRGGKAMPSIPTGTTRVQIPPSRSLDPSKKTSVGRQADPLVWIEDTTPASPSGVVKLYDLTLDGASRYRASSGVRFVGVLLMNVSGWVMRCTIENFQQSPVAGGQCAGIMVDGVTTYANSNNVTIYGCTVRNVQKAGIAAFEGVIQVRNCRVLGYGPVVALAQVGIQFGPSGSGGPAARGSIHGCEVSGFEYTGFGYAASGILLSGPTGVMDVTANTVAGCDVGIYVGGTVAGIGANRIHGNTINDYEFQGIYTKAAGTGSYFGNRFRGSRPLSVPVSDDGPATGLKNLWLGNQFHDQASLGNYEIAGNAGNFDPVARPAAAPFEGSTARFTSSNDPIDLAVADLNADGKLDVVVANHGNDTIDVHYGAGPGGYAATETIVLPTGSSPVAVATGHLASTTRTDIAVACEKGTVVVLLNNGGPSAYDRFPPNGSPVTITGTGVGALQKPSAIAVGDVDGLDRDDILLSLAGNPTLTVPGGALLLTNGGAATSFAGSNPFGSAIASSFGCALIDLDGDNDLDAVIGDAGLAVPKLVSNVRTFSNAGGVLTAGPVLTAGLSPRGLACGDLDGDNRPDLVVANYGNPTLAAKGTVSVLLNASTTTLAFQPAVNTPVGLGTINVAIGDLYGDDSVIRHRDVVAVNFTDSTVTALLDWRSFSAGGVFGVSQTLTGISAPLGGVAIADRSRNFSDDLLVSNAGTDDVTEFAGEVGATLEYYGQGCHGYQKKLPVIWADAGYPSQPNRNFGIALANARPNSPAVLVASWVRPNPIPPDCGVLLLSLDFAWPIPTDASGRARLPFAMPSLPPDLSGLSLYWQWAIVDPEGNFAGLALSNAVRIKLGH